MKLARGKFAKHARKLTLRVLRTRKPILQICKASKQFPKECNLFMKHARKLLHAYMYAAARTQFAIKCNEAN